jgi:opacity protein-like surface antigen
VNRWFGGTFQASGHYKSPTVLGTKNRESMFSAMYGPRFSYRMPWASAYGHILLGVGKTSVTVSPGPHASETAFAIAGGAGLDINLGSRVAVRALQIQYSPMNQVATRDHKFQASSGIVFYVGTQR